MPNPDLQPGFSSDSAYDPNDIVADPKDLFARGIKLHDDQIY